MAWAAVLVAVALVAVALVAVGLVAVALAAVVLAAVVLAAVVLAAVFVAGALVAVDAEAEAFFVVRVVAAATPVVAGSMTTSMPCSPSARSTIRPRLALTSAARIASATSCPVTVPVVPPLRTSDCSASWENSGGRALPSGAFVDTGDTDYLSSRMATSRGRAKHVPGAAGRVLCDTASCVPVVVSRGWRPGVLFHYKTWRASRAHPPGIPGPGVAAPGTRRGRRTPRRDVRMPDVGVRMPGGRGRLEG